MPNRIKQLLHAVSEMDLDQLRESVDIECKLALGQDGKGEIPRSLWESYSAFANTNGGIIVMGVKERRDGSFEIHGVQNIEQIKHDFFNLANNPQKVSYNLVQDSDFVEKTIDGKTILFIGIDRASREVQPVFINGNPLGNTYARQYDGDYKLTEHQIKRMLADQVQESFDDEVLPDFGIQDLDSESLRAYRQQYANIHTGNAINLASDEDFLKHINAIRYDRKTGKTGLTKAGLLMFGKHHFILEVFPNYFIDYQEKADGPYRWADRIVPDLTWSGNLFDFFFKVIRRLTADLKVPFKLDGIFRQDETPAHEALREALVNTLVHADYADRVSLLITKHAKGFTFRNPGLMRIPVELSYKGGYPDCRNRILHQMFRLIKIGEQSGSGVPKVINNWKSQHWQTPVIRELRTPNFHTELTLNMIDYLPNQIMDKLQETLGSTFTQLSSDERIILALSSLEAGVDHARLLADINCHPADLSKMLQRLKKLGLLQSTGGRYAIYTLAADISDTAQANGHSNNTSSEANVLSKPSNGHSKEPKVLSNSAKVLSKSSKVLSSDTNSEAKVLSKNTSSVYQIDPNVTRKLSFIQINGVDIPFIDNLMIAPIAIVEKLDRLSFKTRENRRLSQERIERTILRLSEEHYITSQVLSDLLGREKRVLRRYLSPLVKEGRLILAFPETPTHKKQAYRTVITPGLFDSADDWYE